MRLAIILCSAAFLFACAGDQERTQNAPRGAAAAPSPSPASTPSTPAEAPDAPKNVTLDRPGVDEAIRSNPFTLSGTARTFENNVSLRILDGDGKVILHTYATATGELGNFNPWKREILLSSHPGDKVTLEAFESSAKDGSVQSLVSRTMSFDVPVREVTLFVHDPRRAPNDCTRVFPVQHELPATQAISRALVEALMRSPDSPFPPGGELRRIALRDGVLSIDFNERLQSVGGACRAQAIRASLERTLGDLPGVDRIEITAMGSSTEALQP